MKKDVDIYFQIFKDTQYEKMWDIVLKKELVINQVIKKEELSKYINIEKEYLESWGVLD